MEPLQSKAQVFPAVVRLSVPAVAEYVQIARLAGSALATRLGFSIDEVDDVRIGIDELAAVAVRAAIPASSLEVSFMAADGKLDVRGEAPCAKGDQATVSELTERILDVVTDDYGVECAAEQVTFWLTKRTQPDDL